MIFNTFCSKYKNKLYYTSIPIFILYIGFKKTSVNCRRCEVLVCYLNGHFKFVDYRSINFELIMKTEIIFLRINNVKNMFIF